MKGYITRVRFALLFLSLYMALPIQALPSMVVFDFVKNISFPKITLPEPLTDMAQKVFGGFARVRNSIPALKGFDSFGATPSVAPTPVVTIPAVTQAASSTPTLGPIVFFAVATAAVGWLIKKNFYEDEPERLIGYENPIGDTNESL